jgi:hypothetical protein
MNMKTKLTVSLCAAVAFAAYACPVPARAQSGSTPQPAQTSGQTSGTAGQNNSSPTYNSQTAVPQTNATQNSNSQAVPSNQTGNSSQSSNSSWNSSGQNGQSQNSNAASESGQNQNSHWQKSNNSANSPAARQEAMKMVTAQAKLTETLDAKNAQTGQQIKAKLQNDVQLKNGPKLPEGTMLLGKVTTDSAQQNNARLAICFDHAKLTDGKTVPIKATVVGVAGPRNTYANNATGQMNQPASTAYAETWTPSTLQVDQVNAMSGVDLHSKIGSRNSAVFVSKSNDDLKIDSGSRLTLAIAKQGESQNIGSASSM